MVDECHEALFTDKSHKVKNAYFKEEQRGGACKFLGVAQTIPAWGPLVAAMIWRLTCTPLFETEALFTELANLMEGTYVTRAAQHWRKEEPDSGHYMFLKLQEGNGSRDY